MSKRTWREKQVNPVDPVHNYEHYLSYQKIINSNNGQVNEELLEEHIDEIMSDPKYKWEEIEVDFSNIEPGDRIRYTTLTPKGEYMFRTGGWVTAVDEGGEWLAYMAHTKTSWTLQAKDCQRIFIIKKIKKVKHMGIINFKTPTSVGKYNAYLEKDGRQVLVGSFKDNWTLDRFISSSKYRRAFDGHPWNFI